jgi:hypothetical protein
VDRNRRSGFDRRKQTGVNVRTIIGNGSRTTVRRQEGGCHLFLVDQYSTSLFVPIVSILFLSAIDALFTMYLLNHGAYETNPLMAYLLNVGPYAFFVSKYLITIFGVFCLLMSRGFVVRKWKMNSHVFLYIFACGYIALIGWELFLVYHVV